VHIYWFFFLVFVHENVVDSAGGDCKSTVILNRSFEVSNIKDFISNDIGVRFSIFIFYIFCVFFQIKYLNYFSKI
jgi:hypothetical protein